MKKLSFTQHVLPHALAIIVFLIVTVFFFKPIFFENKTLYQHDVQQSIGASKAIADYREKTGEEALWAPNMFSGMPAYLISVQWSYGAVTILKRILSVGLPHPVANIFAAFTCYYIMLLAFRVRPYLAIAGALAFGLSSFMVIGFSAGHNARIGAMAFIPLVMAGIHLAFTQRRVLGFAVTATGLALHLRENHLQVTYYLLLIVLAYGLMQLIVAIRDKKVIEVFKNVALLIPAALLAVGTFFGQLWAVSEYSKYSTRGKSELVSPAAPKSESGLDRDYVFNYSNGILEPLTILVPNFYGGSSQHYLVRDQESETFQALVNSGDQQLANQLAQYSTPYWGPQPLAAPYYAGAIIVFLAVIGLLLVERKYMWWLVSISAIAIMMSWGKSFETFNYFLFDFLPGYNKFRSVTFALVIVFFGLPLLGMLGLEKLFEQGITQATRKKLWIALGATGGVCLLLLIFGGMFSFLHENEASLPDWFAGALRDDRQSLMKSDAFRSLAFIAAIFIVLYFNLIKKVAPAIVYGFLIFFIMIDLAVVDQRYFDKENYKRKREAVFTLTASEQRTKQDNSYYRIFHVSNDARPAYYFNSITGYHGAKLRRYQDLLDSCVFNDLNEFFDDAQHQTLDYKKYGVLNMLNCKYVIFGENANEVVLNNGIGGAAWFVGALQQVNSPTEELAALDTIDTRTTAVMDISKFKAPEIQFDSLSQITLQEVTPRYLKYESESATSGLGVFSEIYYADGWVATIDGKEATIMRVNYVLRALAIPAGNHTIEFRFEPRAYVIGNKITFASSWILLLVLLGSIGWSLKEDRT